MIPESERQELERRFYPDLQRAVFDEFEERFLAALGHRPVLLDLGSGPGSWLIAEHRDRVNLWIGADVYQPDVSQFDGFVFSSADQLPFAADTFDVVVCYNVVEHLREPENVFREIARILRPGGYFCFKTPCVHSPLFFAAHLLPTSLHKRLKGRIGIAEEDVFPTYYRANSLKSLDRQLQSVGFLSEWVRQVDQTYAYLSHSRWSYMLGLIYSRCTEWFGLAWLRNQIIGVYRLKGVE